MNSKKMWEPWNIEALWYNIVNIFSLLMIFYTLFEKYFDSYRKYIDEWFKIMQCVLNIIKLCACNSNLEQGFGNFDIWMKKLLTFIKTQCFIWNFVEFDFLTNYLNNSKFCIGKKNSLLQLKSNFNKCN